MDLQRRAWQDSSAAAAGAAPATVGRTLASPGQPMDGVTRREMESRLGHDFAAVRVHADAAAGESALAVGASAYTVGRHVAFAPGSYQPTTARGRQLLAHELTHVVQQEGMRRPQPGAVRMSGPDSARERHAEAAGRHAVPGGSGQDSAMPAPAGAAQRDPSPDARLNLTIDERGRIDLTLSGPDVTVIPKPTLGVRRLPGGNYDLLFGSGGKTVAATEVPEVLRGLVGAGRPAGTPVPLKLRIPECPALQAASGTRLMTFDEYRVARMISGELLPMTRTLYEILIERCRSGEAKPAPAPLPVTPLESAPHTAPP